MAAVYILYSEMLDRYYVGSSRDFATRLAHLDKDLGRGFTAKAADWKAFLVIDNLEYRQARSVESHIKRMKSRKYIEDLKRFPEISQRLILKYEYGAGSSR